MEIHNLYQLFWLFLFYSFGGWLLETSVFAVKKKKFANPGILNAPLCIVYGIAAAGITVGFQELKDAWFFLFLGSMIFATFIEWTAGRMLEKMSRKRWWDYSGHRFQLDGYISLPTSILWGLLGVAGMKFVNPLVLKLFEVLPFGFMKILLWVSFGILLLDAGVSYLAAKGLQKKIPEAEKLHNRIGVVTVRFGNWISGKIIKRIAKAHPTTQKQGEENVEEAIFAKGIDFYKLFLLFFIGAFLGDITETLFCRLTTGIWMSRSSVVWGPFSLVWGLGIMLATALLYKYKERSDSFLFLFGLVLGGAYEYICSVFTEMAFGKVFWDYRSIPFNLGGRINLLFCFFWGIAAVVWFKKVYPFFAKLIEKIPIKAGRPITWILVVFMACNIVFSGLAMTRYSERGAGKAAESDWQYWMDIHYNDVKMEKIYPNAKSIN